MKRVLFVCSLYHPHVGGIETMVTELARFYRNQGLESVVLTKQWPTDLAANDRYEGLPIYRVPSAKTDLEFGKLIDQVLEHEQALQADVVHVIGLRRPLPLIGLLLSRRWQVPLIATVAGGEVPDTNDPATQAVWDESMTTVRPVLDHAEVITCVSEATRQQLLVALPTVQRTRTIYAGIDLEMIVNVTPAISRPKPYILSLRRLVPSKGIDTLIDAFATIAPTHPTLTLVIAGEGPEKASLKSQALQSGLADRIHFIGSVPLEDGIGLLKSAVCTVVPSRSEGGGLVNVEAQAAGCPVLASRVGGIPEYLHDDIGGLLFESGNAEELAALMDRLASDSTLCARLSQQGQEFAHQFDWKILGHQYLDLYKETENIELQPFTPNTSLSALLWEKLKGTPA
ncbi:glycosyltransferase family 4 protein [Candidatus Berkelbacteria bacterium]|nr:glycosyltransferase family 4 protein [Candidatus Berkelbacteria bacterium]